MKVILATKIEGLGCEADLVTVKAGYGRNYLIPQGLAFEATPANQRFINMLQKKRAEREAAELANFQEIAAEIAAVTVNLTLEAGENLPVGKGKKASKDEDDEPAADDKPESSKKKGKKKKGKKKSKKAAEEA